MQAGKATCMENLYMGVCMGYALTKRTKHFKLSTTLECERRTQIKSDDCPQQML